MISIIIPTFNEAKNISRLITYLRNSSEESDIEIIVSDGGSTDNTIEIAQLAGAAAVLSPQKGRAAQMNFAASVSKGNVLYFVHADTFPPQSFVADINKAIAQGYECGRYKTRFDSNKVLLKINAFFTRFNWFVCCGGDQTFFVSRQLFTKINGFSGKMRIMEDFDISVRAKQTSTYKIFPKNALVSARKYDTNSWFKVQLANSTIVKMYKKGATQQEMVDKYKEMLDYNR